MKSGIAIAKRKVKIEALINVNIRKSQNYFHQFYNNKWWSYNITITIGLRYIKMKV
jgi:hypothetical protein